MALVYVPSLMFLPEIAVSSSFNYNRTGKLLDNPADYDGIVVQVSPMDDGKTISELAINIKTVVDQGLVDARVESMKSPPTDAFPSGTLASANSNKSQMVSVTGWNTFTLTSGHVVSSGEVLGIKFVLGVTASASITTRYSTRGISGSGNRFPYSIRLIDPAGEVTGQLNAAQDTINCAIGFSDGTYAIVPGIKPSTGGGLSSIISTGVAEVGLEFQVPFAATLAAIFVQVDNDGNLSFNIGDSSYVPGDTGATRLSATSWDKDIARGSTIIPSVYYLSTPVDLSANTTYVAVLAATEAATSKLYYADLNAAEIKTAWGMGSTWQYIVDDGAGGWTKTATRLPMIALGFSKIDDGAGGGNNIVIARPRRTM